MSSRAVAFFVRFLVFFTASATVQGVHGLRGERLHRAEAEDASRAYSALAADGNANSETIRVSGSWTLEGHDIKVGELIPDGACVIGKGELRVRRKNLEMYYTCAEGSETGCASPPKGLCTRRVPPSGKFAGYAERLLSLVAPLLGGNSERYAVAASRDLGFELREAVLPANRPAADVTPMIAALPPGEYTFQVVRIDNPQAAQKFHMSWGPKAAAIISTSAPGLYRVMVLGTSGEFTGADAWALAVNQESIASATDSFARAVEVTDSWKHQVTDDSIRSVLRAYLQALWQQKVTDQ